MATHQNLSPPPPTREEILAKVGSHRAQIYKTVRKILDDFETVARWEQLYYPPAEVEEFLRIQTCMLALIEEIPYRISEISVQILTSAFTVLLDPDASSVIDRDTREMVRRLLDPEVARRATPSTRKIAFDTIDSLPPAAVTAPQKLLLKWIIDRQVPEPTVEFTGDEFEAAIHGFPEEVIDSSLKEILANIQFYFDGIHEMTSGDLDKLRGRIKLFQSAEAAQLSAQERVFTCEISADLKGKYTSAMMGAAANLVAEGIWHGAEIEPILFPEKAEEFRRNEQLVEALKEVLESIKRLPDEVPLIKLVAAWEEKRRVDQYALSHLYGFLGTLGKLMKETSRRALYSGDYHQVQMREHRLSRRINELNMLHNKSWEVLDESDPDIRGHYPDMALKAIELATILDVELLKKLIGEEKVQLLLRIVSLEAEKRREHEVRLGHERNEDYRTPQSIELRAQLPERLHPLIELLYDEDLETFLELLLGSVMKRASFAVRRREEAAPSPELGLAAAAQDLAGVEAVALPPEEMLHFKDLDELDFEILPESGNEPAPNPSAPNRPAPAPPPVANGAPPTTQFLSFSDEDDGAALAAPGAAPPEEPTAPALAGKRAALEKLRDLLQNLNEPSSSERKSFDLFHRLLTRKSVVPPSMMQSIQPFLESLADTVLPQLATVSAQGDISITFQSELSQYCRDLSRRDLTPRDMKTVVLTNLEGLLRLLGDIEAAAVEVIDTYPQGSGLEGHGLTDSSSDVLPSVE